MTGRLGLLKTKAFVLPPFSMHVESEYVQHAGPVGVGDANILYRVNIKLPDAIELSSCGTLCVKK